ncbi:unnamed protein product [Amoebophrya sp. A120]|nr:unnamed protein product [Amoebophrya sp. A120]|eukprot:GSA120T00025290001.1
MASSKPPPREKSLGRPRGSSRGGVLQTLQEFNSRPLNMPVNARRRPESLHRNRDGPAHPLPGPPPSGVLTKGCSKGTTTTKGNIGKSAGIKNGAKQNAAVATVPGTTTTSSKANFAAGASSTTTTSGEQQLHQPAVERTCATGKNGHQGGKKAGGNDNEGASKASGSKTSCAPSSSSTSKLATTSSCMLTTTTAAASIISARAGAAGGGAGSSKITTMNCETGAETVASSAATGTKRTSTEQAPKTTTSSSSCSSAALVKTESRGQLYASQQEDQRARRLSSPSTDDFAVLRSETTAIGLVAQQKVCNRASARAATSTSSKSLHRTKNAASADIKTADRNRNGFNPISRERTAPQNICGSTEHGQHTATKPGETHTTKHDLAGGHDTAVPGQLKVPGKAVSSLPTRPSSYESRGETGVKGTSQSSRVEFGLDNTAARGSLPTGRSGKTTTVPAADQVEPEKKQSYSLPNLQDKQVDKMPGQDAAPTVSSSGVAAAAVAASGGGPRKITTTHVDKPQKEMLNQSAASSRGMASAITSIGTEKPEHRKSSANALSSSNTSSNKPPPVISAKNRRKSSRSASRVRGLPKIETPRAARHAKKKRKAERRRAKQESKAAHKGNHKTAKPFEKGEKNNQRHTTTSRSSTRALASSLPSGAAGREKSSGQLPGGAPWMGTATSSHGLNIAIGPQRDYLQAGAKQLDIHEDARATFGKPFADAVATSAYASASAQQHTLCGSTPSRLSVETPATGSTPPRPGGSAPAEQVVDQNQGNTKINVTIHSASSSGIMKDKSTAASSGAPPPTRTLQDKAGGATRERTTLPSSDGCYTSSDDSSSEDEETSSEDDTSSDDSRIVDTSSEENDDVQQRGTTTSGAGRQVAIQRDEGTTTTTKTTPAEACVNTGQQAATRASPHQGRGTRDEIKNAPPSRGSGSRKNSRIIPILPPIMEEAESLCQESSSEEAEVLLQAAKGESKGLTTLKKANQNNDEHFPTVQLAAKKSTGEAVSSSSVALVVPAGREQARAGGEEGKEAGAGKAAVLEVQPEDEVTASARGENLHHPEKHDEDHDHIPHHVSAADALAALSSAMNKIYSRVVDDPIGTAKYVVKVREARKRVKEEFCLDPDQPHVTPSEQTRIENEVFAAYNRFLKQEQAAPPGPASTSTNTKNDDSQQQQPSPFPSMKIWRNGQAVDGLTRAEWLDPSHPLPPEGILLQGVRGRPAANPAEKLMWEQNRGTWREWCFADGPAPLCDSGPCMQRHGDYDPNNPKPKSHFFHKVSLWRAEDKKSSDAGGIRARRGGDNGTTSDNAANAVDGSDEKEVADAYQNRSHLKEQQAGAPEAASTTSKLGGASSSSRPESSTDNTVVTRKPAFPQTVKLEQNTTTKKRETEQQEKTARLSPPEEASGTTESAEAKNHFGAALKPPGRPEGPFLPAAVVAEPPVLLAGEVAEQEMNERHDDQASGDGAAPPAEERNFLITEGRADDHDGKEVRWVDVIDDYVSFCPGNQNSNKMRLAEPWTHILSPEDVAAKLSELVEKREVDHVIKLNEKNNGPVWMRWCGESEHRPMSAQFGPEEKDLRILYPRKIFVIEDDEKPADEAKTTKAKKTMKMNKKNNKGSKQLISADTTANSISSTNAGAAGGGGTKAATTTTKGQTNNPGEPASSTAPATSSTTTGAGLGPAGAAASGARIAATNEQATNDKGPPAFSGFDEFEADNLGENAENYNPSKFLNTSGSTTKATLRMPPDDHIDPGLVFESTFLGTVDDTGDGDFEDFEDDPFRPGTAGRGTSLLATMKNDKKMKSSKNNNSTDGKAKFVLAKQDEDLPLLSRGSTGGRGKGGKKSKSNKQQEREQSNDDSSSDSASSPVEDEEDDLLADDNNAAKKPVQAKKTAVAKPKAKKPPVKKRKDQAPKGPARGSEEDDELDNRGKGRKKDAIKLSKKGREVDQVQEAVAEPKKRKIKEQEKPLAQLQASSASGLGSQGMRHEKSGEAVDPPAASPKSDEEKKVAHLHKMRIPKLKTEYFEEKPTRPYLLTRQGNQKTMEEVLSSYTRESGIEWDEAPEKNVIRRTPGIPNPKESTIQKALDNERRARIEVGWDCICLTSSGVQAFPPVPPEVLDNQRLWREWRKSSEEIRKKFVRRKDGDGSLVNYWLYPAEPWNKDAYDLTKRKVNRRGEEIPSSTDDEAGEDQEVQTASAKPPGSSTSSSSCTGSAGSSSSRAAALPHLLSTRNDATTTSSRLQSSGSSATSASTAGAANKGTAGRAVGKIKPNAAPPKPCPPHQGGSSSGKSKKNSDNGAKRKAKAAAVKPGRKKSTTAVKKREAKQQQPRGDRSDSKKVISPEKKKSSLREKRSRVEKHVKMLKKKSSSSKKKVDSNCSSKEGENCTSSGHQEPLSSSSAPASNAANQTTSQDEAASASTGFWSGFKNGISSVLFRNAHDKTSNTTARDEEDKINVASTTSKEENVAGAKSPTLEKKTKAKGVRAKAEGKSANRAKAKAKASAKGKNKKPGTGGGVLK